MNLINPSLLCQCIRLGSLLQCALNGTSIPSSPCVLQLEIPCVPWTQIATRRSTKTVHVKQQTPSVRGLP